ncbi:MAG TPA: hypothetical protein VFH73_12650 [Polyangia bacterium]|nr:hypothetical protein [Polyangia bacterium]
MSTGMKQGQASVTVPVLLAAFVSLLAIASPAAAADSPIGTWVKKAEGGKSEMTMTIETWGSNKAKLTYHLKQQNIVLTIVATLDGTDAPVLINGKPSGETMAITLVDKRHSSTVIKMNGKLFGTSRGSFSEDFQTLTVENDFTQTVGGNTAGRSSEVWTRK